MKYTLGTWGKRGFQFHFVLIRVQSFRFPFQQVLTRRFRFRHLLRHDFRFLFERELELYDLRHDLLHHDNNRICY